MTLFPWTRTIAELQGSLADVSEELRAALAALSEERQKRMTLESLAQSRLELAHSEAKRADDACKARDEAMRLVIQSKAVEVLPDLKNFKPILRKKQEDPWLGPKFVARVNQIAMRAASEPPTEEDSNPQKSTSEVVQ